MSRVAFSIRNWTCALLWLSLAVPSQGADFDSLIRRIPDTANSVIVLDVEALFKSELGQKENWKATYSDSFAASPVMVPPSSRRYLVAAELDVESMKPIWEVAAMELAVDPTITDVSHKLGGGAVDKISGVDALWTNRKNCIVKFAPHEFGYMSPANRASASRWVTRAMQGDNTALSPYLRSAIGYAKNAGPEVIMAVDLANIIRPEEMRKAVGKSKVLGGLDQEKVTQLLLGLRGVTLGVRVTDHIVGKLIVDFEADASDLKEVAKPLILQVLSNVGASLDEAADWQPAVTGKRISLSGKMTPEGMRRLFSLVALDSSIMDSAPPAAAPKAATSPDVGTSTRKYYQGVMKYLGDLQKARNTHSLATVTLWASNFSRKIAKLPTYNVDPDMVAYGQFVASELQNAVASVQGIDINTADRVSQIVPNASVRVGALPTWNTANFGGYFMREYAPFATTQVDIGAALQERNQIEAEEYQKGMAAAEAIIDNLRSVTEETRAKMEQRYGSPF